MNKASNRANLKAKLQTKLAEESANVEKLTTKQLQELTTNLKKEISSVVNTIEKDTKSNIKKALEPLYQAIEHSKAETKAIHWSLAKAWMKPLLIGLSASLGIFLGSWGIMQYLSNEIQTLSQDKETLSQDKETLSQFQAKGMKLYIFETEDFWNPEDVWIQIPKGKVLQHNGEDIGGQPAYKLVDK